jgi:hypothetical protein
MALILMMGMFTPDAASSLGPLLLGVMIIGGIGVALMILKGTLGDESFKTTPVAPIQPPSYPSSYDSPYQRANFTVPGGPWDAFICHASEDKEAVARPLAQMLNARNMKVWFDDDIITLGDSLRSSIDYGLANSTFGIVILSPSFFRKKWTILELNGLLAKQISAKTILPVWHEVDHDFVARHSPILADMRAVSTANGLRPVVDEIVRAYRVSRGV